LFDNSQQYREKKKTDDKINDSINGNNGDDDNDVLFSLLFVIIRKTAEVILITLLCSFWFVCFGSVCLFFIKDKMQFSCQKGSIPKTSTFR